MGASHWQPIKGTAGVAAPLSTRAVPRAAPQAALMPSPSPAAVIALQRAAGNAATTAAVSRPVPAARTLARCAGGCTCGGRCGKAEDEEIDAFGSRMLARAVSRRQTLQRMAACPSRLADSDPTPPGWRPYHGNSSWFHCGFRGILEDRRPTPDDPMNECFYDHSGRLVDDTHPYAGCGGTPDQYYSATDPVKHALIDRGGIVRAGGPAFLESRLHDFDRAVADPVANFIDQEIAQPIGRWFDRGIRGIYGVP